jgi:hypothetical protein
MPEPVTIPISIVEVTIEFTRPNMKLLVDRATAVDQLFEAFVPWNVKVDDVEVITEGKPSEQGVKFKLPVKRTSFQFGAASCKLTRDDADWESAGETIKILDTGWRVLERVGGVKVRAFKTAIALHLQPKITPFVELLKPFAAMPLASVDPSPIRAVAAVVKWEKRRITVDGSGQLANGVFLRFEREFEGSATYDQMAAQLKTDEDELFALLDVKEDRP